MNRKYFIILLSIIFLLNQVPTFAVATEETNIDDTSDHLEIFGEGAILIDGNSGQILYEKNPHLQLYPASTTKIMTAILAIELGNMEDIVTVDQEVVDLTDGTHIALEPGEQATLDELLKVMLIGSANDAALAIAKHISGSIDVFIELMNNKAKEIGAKNTNFVNPNGLHDDNHVSTAYDLALIGQYAMKNDTFRNIVKEYIYTLEPTNKKEEPRFLKSNNRLIYSSRKINVNGDIIPTKYEGANGIKTGFTKKAQSCLVSSVENNNGYLIAVVLKSDGQNLFSDTHKLFNYGFENFENKQLTFKNEFVENFPIKNGNPSYIAGVVKENLFYNAKKGESQDIKKEIKLVENLELPLKKGDKIGTLEYYIGDNLVGDVDIVSTADVEVDPNTKLHKKLLNNWYWFVFLVLFLLRINQYRKRIKVMEKRKNRQERSS